MDNDLLTDVSYYFREKYGHNKYVTTEIIKALGIYPFDKNMRNSIKFTKDGYSDWFGLIISESLLRRLKNMTEEEKNAEIDARREGLEKWWNSMSYEQQIELATSVDVQEEGYKSYKKYDNESRRRNRKYILSLPDFINYEEDKKKTKKPLKLNNKEVYILWMQNNLAKFYELMSETEKLAFEVERSAKMARRWSEMTPEERVEYIKSIKDGIEPLRIAMIDAWNHSRILIMTLREFLKAQQVFKPVELVYDTEEFMNLQSKIMTEFWIQNKDLAEQFGRAMRASHQKVKEAIRNNTFEQFKANVLLEKDERIKKIQEQYKAEAEEKKQAQEAKIKEKEAAIPKEDVQYRNEFAEVYKKAIDKHGILPPTYVKEMTEIFLDRFPKDIVVRYTNSLKNLEPIPEDVMEYITNEQEKNDEPRAERIQRALEAAISAEMTSKGATHSFFQLGIDTLIKVLNHKYEDRSVPKSRRVDKYKITRLYNEFERNLSDKELNTIANSYFNTKRDLTEEENEMFENYLNSFGRSLLILFSHKSAYSDSVKFSFNEKFLRLMPHKIKEFIYPFIKTPEDIFEENEINSLIAQIYSRFKYLPDDILKIYTKEIAITIRLDRKTHENKYLEKFKNTFYTKATADQSQTFPGFEKKLMSKEEIFKILAIEQALADELYRVTQNNMVYSKDFEQLLNFYDMTSIMKNHEIMNLQNKDGILLLTIKEKPNTKILQTKYLEYLNAIKSNKDIINPDGTINKEKLLYCLNPSDGRPEKFLGTQKRIDTYFADTKEPSQTSAESKAETETIPLSDEIKKEFRTEYILEINPKNILPSNYAKEMSEIILETFPKEAIEEYTLNPSARDMFSIDKIKKHCSKENLIRLNRINHALETAIADELVSHGGDSSLYGESVETLISELKKQEFEIGHRKKHKINTENIQQEYNDYKKELSLKELTYIVNSYFISDNPTQEKDKLIMDYIKEYGKTIEILLSKNTSYSLKEKAAFNDKFLKLMPQEVKEAVTPIIQNIEDIKADLDIENVRRKVAKRFDFLPKDPLYIYTLEAANVMRIMRMPDVDPELKENYNMEKFRNSVDKNYADPDLISSVLNFPKYLITNNISKLYLLALEQAMADELFRVSQNNIVYKYELENLALWFELGAAITKENRKGMEFKNSDNDEGFILKEKPNINNVTQRYVGYMKAFDNREDLFLEEGGLNREAILCCLNPNEDLPDRDKFTEERIDGYFED